MSGLRKRPHRGFTLVELLVVIGIIALLIAILLPSLSKAREHGKMVHCLANLRAIGQSMVMYVNENRGRYPVMSSYDWWNNQTPDFANPDVYDNWDFMRNVKTPGMNFLGGLIRTNRGMTKSLLCISAEPYPGTDTSRPQTSYMINALFVNRKMSKVRRPSELIVIQEDRFHYGTLFCRPTRNYVDPTRARAELGAFYADPWQNVLAVTHTANDQYGYWSYQPSGAIAQYSNLHVGGGNFLYADGHAAWMHRTDLRAKHFGLTGGPGVSGSGEDRYNLGWLSGRNYRSAID
jgi:prepilin-type N-terminal cleavage/methylation domain-containing protein/prepilin-type processing-associated H-X9-DG protein